MLIELTMVLVILSMIIYVMLPAPVINVARYLTVLSMLVFAAFVSLTIFVNQAWIVLR